MSKLCIVRCNVNHGHPRFGGINEVLFPTPLFYQSRVITSQTVHYPMRGSHMRIVVRTAKVIGFFFRPCRPGFKVYVFCVSTFRQRIRRIIKQAFFHSVFLRTIFQLYMAKHYRIYKLFQFSYFFFFGMHQLFHHGTQPRTRATLIT
ncbi:hypothetical protein D3C85_849190 [compost metagenome]